MFQAADPLTDVDPVVVLEQSTQQLQNDSDDFETVSKRIADASQAIEDCFLAQSGSSYALFAALSNVNSNAIYYTADVEYALTEPRLQSRSPQTTIDTLTFSQDNFQVVIAPAGFIQLGWALRPGALPRPGALFVDCPFQLLINGALQGAYILRLEVLMSMNTTNRTISLLQVVAARFCQTDGTLYYKLLQNVPRENNMRQQFLVQLNATIDDALAKMVITLPAPPASFNLTVTPHAYRITEAFISFIARVLPPRRKKNALIGWFEYPNSEALRINKPLVIQNMSEQVTTYGVGLVNAWFCYDSLIFEAQKHYEDGVCWADVTVDVFLVYSVALVSDIPGRLLAMADFWGDRPYGYQINVQNCFPFCNEISDQVQDQILSQIDSYRHQAFPFADLRGYASNVQGYFDPEGVMLMLEPTS